MKTVAIAVASFFTTLAPGAFAQTYYGENYRDNYRYDRGRDAARVIESRPVYETANTKEECWNPRAVQCYDVRYEYAGREYTTRMSRDPGRRLVLGDDVRSDGTPYDSVASYSTPSYSWR